MKPAFLFSVGLTIALCCSAQASSPTPAQMISKYRLEHGAGRVTLDPTLTRIAQEQAAAMASKDTLDHSVLAPFSARVSSLRSERAAENIAYGHESFAKTLNQWIESQGHRNNLLMPGASRIGIASAKSHKSSRIYWAMVIAGERKSTAMQAANIRHNARAAKHQTQRRTCRISILSLCLQRD